MKLLVIIITSLTIISCSSNTFLIDRKCKKMDFSDKTLGIVFPFGVEISYQGDLSEGETGRTNEEIVTDFIIKKLATFIEKKSSFKRVEIIKCLPCKSDTGREAVLSYFENTKRHIIKDESFNPDYILGVYDLSVESQLMVDIVLSGFVPVTAIPSKPLNIKSFYVLWENVQGNPVARGSLAVTKKNLFKVSVSEKTFDHVFEEFAIEIFKGTPFQKSSS